MAYYHRGEIFKTIFKHTTFYENELELQFKKGQLTEINRYDNSQFVQSVYSYNQDTLWDFIFSNVNWEIIPDKDEDVIVCFSANENGEIDSVVIDCLKEGKSELDPYRIEADRVVRLIPYWDIYFIKGKQERLEVLLWISFNDFNRKKYNKKKIKQTHNKK